jgi:transposase
MLTVAPGTKVYLAAGRVDLRRGHDGLCALVRGVLSLDPFSGHLFVFAGRRGDGFKVLYWGRGGFVLYYKRLAKGAGFASRPWPPGPTASSSTAPSWRCSSADST